MINCMDSFFVHDSKAGLWTTRGLGDDHAAVLEKIRGAIARRGSDDGCGIVGDERAGVDLMLQGQPPGRTDWRPALTNVDVVVPLAALVNVMSETDADPELAFQRVNVDAAVALARQAKEVGVPRFAFTELN